MKKISVIVPVYAGEFTLKKLNTELINFFNSQKQLAFQIVYVYDCGKDNSKEVLQSLKNDFPNFIDTVFLTRNFGQHNALIAGIEKANGDYIVTMDEDLQHNPKDIMLLLKKQEENNYDVVYGNPLKTEHSKFRNLTSRMMKKLLNIALPELHSDYSAFRLIKRTIAKEIVPMRNSYTFLDGYLSWVTESVTSVHVSHSKRIGGESSYTLKKLIEHSLNIFFTFSNLPIRMVSYTSIFVFILSLAYSIYVVYIKIIYNDIALGFSGLILAIGFGISLILLSLGIIGEYLYRVNLKTTKRPNYVVRKNKIEI